MLPQCGRSLKDPDGEEVTVNSLRSDWKMKKCWSSSKERPILVFRHLARRGQAVSQPHQETELLSVRVELQ